MDSLVGYTGFVGSNLTKQHKFDGLYHSKNIGDAYGTTPDLLVYAGVPAQKFIANQNPMMDRAIIGQAIENIKKIHPRRLVLISTVDVYQEPVNVDETAESDPADMPAYGANRYFLEQWVEQNLDDYSIIRLPGLYGDNIKKNFIYDYLYRIPSLLNSSKVNELAGADPFFEECYELQDNGFYRCRALTQVEEERLRDSLEQADFSALNFTDSRGIFQFYNLRYLWGHIELVEARKLKKVNLAVEPVRISELYEYLEGMPFMNEISNQIPHYDFRTIYSHIFGAEGGYIFGKQFVLEDIKKYVEEFKK